MKRSTGRNKEKTSALSNALRTPYQSGPFTASINLSAEQFMDAIGTNKKDLKDFNVGHAAIVSRKTIDTSFFDQDQNLNNLMQPTDPLKRIALAVKYYRIDPIVGKATELQAQFADDGIKMIGLTKKDKNFYEGWANAIAIEQVAHKFFLDYFKTSNVTARRVLVPFTPRIKRSLENGDSSELTIAARKNKWTNSNIPGGYTILNPLCVEVISAQGLGMDILKFKPPQAYFNELKKVNIKNLPSDFAAQMKKGEIILDPTQTFRITRERQDYEPYAIPQSERAFRALFMKHCIQQVDLHTVNGMLTQIIVVTIGDKDFPAKPSQLNALSKTFTKDSKTPFIFGNHTLKVQVIDLNTNRTLEDPKYDHWDSEIRSSFGITKGLMGGESGSMSGAFIDIEGFLASIKEARTDVARVLNDELEFMAEQMQLDTAPIIDFDTSILRDKTRYAQVISNMVQLGILSNETALEQLGFSFETEKDRMLGEKILKEQGIFTPSKIAGVGPNAETDPGSGLTGRPPNDPDPKKTNDQSRGPRGKGPRKGSRASEDGLDWELPCENPEIENDFQELLIRVNAGESIPSEEDIMAEAKLSTEQINKIRACVDSIISLKYGGDEPSAKIKSGLFSICTSRMKK